MNGLFMLAQAAGATDSAAEKPKTLLQSIQEFSQEFTDPEKLAAFAGNVLAAIAIYLVGKIVVRILTSLLEKVMVRAKVDTTLSSFLSNIAHYVLITFVILMAKEHLLQNSMNLNNSGEQNACHLKVSIRIPIRGGSPTDGWFETRLL